MINDKWDRRKGDRLPTWIEIKGSCVFFSFFNNIYNIIFAYVICMAFSQFGLDFETVWWTLFLLLFFISAILWHLSLKGLFDGLIWTLLQKNLKSTLRTVLKAAVQPIWAWFWNGFVDLVPPALLYLYYVIAFVSKRTIWWVNHHHQSSFKNNLFGVSSLSGAPLNDVTKWRRRQLFFSFFILFSHMVTMTNPPPFSSHLLTLMTLDYWIGCRSANSALILKRFSGPCSSCSSASPLFYDLWL